MKMEDVVRYLKTGAAVMATLAISTVLYGVALAVLWGWFVAPLGVRDINVAEAIGITLLVSLVVRPNPDPKMGKMSFRERYIYAFLVSVITSSLVLVLGGVIHLVA